MKRYAQAIFCALMLAPLSACDNVSWGGAEFAIVRPPKVSSTPATSGEEIQERLPEGPLLYYVANTTDGAVMIPVGEIAGDSMLPLRPRKDPTIYAQRFIAEHMRQGLEFVLYRDGSRVGTYVITSAEPPAPNTCPAVPRAIGTMELSSGAVGTGEFLAIPEAYAPEIRRRAGPAMEASGTMRVQAPYLAERLLRARRAPLPGNWQRAMAQLRPFPISGDADPAFAATLLVGDTLGRGADNEGYSLFYIGTPGQMTYDTVYAQFTNYAEAGKAAPRVVDFLDWTRDDQPELLLQVYGINDSWFEAVSRDEKGQFRRIFRDRCEQGASTMPDAQPDSVKADTTTTRN